MRWVKSRSKPEDRPDGWGPEYVLKDGRKTILTLWWIPKKDGPEFGWPEEQGDAREYGWRLACDCFGLGLGEDHFWLGPKGDLAFAKEKAVLRAFRLAREERKKWAEIAEGLQRAQYCL